MTDIPSFDELMQLVQSDPEQFDALKARLIDQQIQDAPRHLQSRLRSVQFQADIKTRNSTNPVSRCVVLSNLMHEALDSLGEVISNPYAYLQNRANVYPLRASRSSHR
ncbi:DUF3135 domain-containing protein [Aestuariirhabdus litorea]|uniref:DUF3135 domain-containing protein n=1 Tax=Aestuariirhabdus litorea TaxID=2528527 RepID=A0A3P3VRN6_9GAMM|nr:DUF3135 domain-containing protein [Aestuariirhabdus litorea]RRJ85290.1 DUF3135 domain-containing protein [Aestuariirhabdus litorea]RWW98512.1 DUF3135 domain-containing protein [Endozoicomonadaceae bacterium GTF-13]